jgi:hypothetical protein
MTVLSKSTKPQLRAEAKIRKVRKPVDSVVAKVKPQNLKTHIQVAREAKVGETKTHTALHVFSAPSRRSSVRVLLV